MRRRIPLKASTVQFGKVAILVLVLLRLSVGWHFFKEGETIQLSDEVIAVSNQWGIGNIGDFVDGSNQNHKADISK